MQLQDLLAERNQEIDMLKAKRMEFEGVYSEFTAKFSKLLAKTSSNKKKDLSTISTGNTIKPKQEKKALLEETEKLCEQLCQREEEIHTLKMEVEELSLKTKECETINECLQDELKKYQCELEDYRRLKDALEMD